MQKILYVIRNLVFKFHPTNLKIEMTFVSVQVSYIDHKKETIFLKFFLSILSLCWTEIIPLSTSIDKVIIYFKFKFIHSHKPHKDGTWGTKHTIITKIKKKKATSEEAVNFKIKMHALLHFAKIEQFNYYHIILISYDPVDLKPLMR